MVWCWVYVEQTIVLCIFGCSLLQTFQQRATSQLVVHARIPVNSKTSLSVPCYSCSLFARQLPFSAASPTSRVLLRVKR
jgi:hypothetical protein